MTTAQEVQADQAGKAVGTFVNRRVHIDDLEPSAMNVRQRVKGDEAPPDDDGAALGGGMSRAVLRATLEAIGLIHPLIVEAAQGGHYAVVAGSRRLAELKDMHAKGLLPDPMIDVREVPVGADRSMISLAENLGRLAMHPADECAAYKKLFEAGKTVPEIAAHFGISAREVQQRLALANLHPTIFAAFRARKLDMEVAQAFAYEADHATQLAVFKQLCGRGHVSPYSVRNALKGQDVPSDHRFVKLVGMEAYRVAGGQVVEDFFDAHGGVMLTDPLLLEGLAAAVLEERANEVRGQGWGWVEVLLNEHVWRLADERKLQSVSAKGLDRQEAGMFVLCRPDGQIAVEGPYTSRKAVKTRERALRRSQDGVDGEASAGASPAEKVPDSLMLSLTAHKSAALQCALLANQRVTLAVLASVMIAPERCFEAGPQVRVISQDRELRSLARGYDGSRAARELAEADAAWSERVPDDVDPLAWFLGQPASVSVDAIVWSCARSFTFANRRQGSCDTVERLGAALAFDFAKYFEPTAETYLGLVPKAKVLEAVTEACGPEIAGGMAGMKKDELVAAAQAALAGKAWLPSAVR